MAQLPNVSFSISTDNLNRLEPNSDTVAGLVLAGIVGLARFPDLSENVFYSLKQAEDLGLTQQYDYNNSVAAWVHISDFFRENPNGELHILTLEDPATIDDVLHWSTGKALAFIRNANGRIKQLAVVLNNPAIHATFMGSISTHLATAQKFCGTMAEEYKWIDVVFLEALGFDIAVGSLTNLRAADNPNVALVVGNDETFLGYDPAYEGTAALGQLLGASTRKPIHESFAEAKTDNTLTDESAQRFLSIRIKKTAPDIYLNDQTAQAALYDRGYIFPRKYALRNGFYWVQSTNLSLPTSDLSSIEMVQVINKAQRVLYSTLLKYINKTFNITAAGRLAFLDRKLVEDDVRNELQTNMAQNYSELVAVIVDPEKDENNQLYPSIQVDNTLRVFVGIRAKGKIIYIAVNVGYTN